MAQGVTPDGIAVVQRVEGTTERKLHAKVVDNFLSSRTYMSRVMGMGETFRGSTKDFTILISDAELGEFFSGLETLSSSAEDDTITLSYAHTAFQQPVVLPMLESFANTGPEATIDLDLNKIETAQGKAIQRLGTAAYGTGSGAQPLGLGAIVDDGTDVDVIGGQSRSTYSTLKATVTASGGTMTLAKLGTLHDNTRAAGIDTEEPTIHLMGKTVWSLYEQLLTPNVRAEYSSVGYDRLSVRGDVIVKPGELKGGAGFTALTYRGIPAIPDDAATAQTWFMLNERYLKWYGREAVPEKFRGQLSKVSLGTHRTTEGVIAAPSESHGFFFQELQMLPNQAGMIGRYYVIGQLCTSQPRRHARLTGITGV